MMHVFLTCITIIKFMDATTTQKKYFSNKFQNTRHVNTLDLNRLPNIHNYLVLYMFPFHYKIRPILIKTSKFHCSLFLNNQCSKYRYPFLNMTLCLHKHSSKLIHLPKELQTLGSDARILKQTISNTLMS